MRESPECCEISSSHILAKKKQNKKNPKLKNQNQTSKIKIKNQTSNSKNQTSNSKNHLSNPIIYYPYIIFKKMGGALAKLFKRLLGNTEVRILIIGLDAAGKSKQKFHS